MPTSVDVTHSDGIVLARSIFNNPINYRSATLSGVGRLITDPAEKTDALLRFSEKLLPGRGDEVRPITDQELKATAVVANDMEDDLAKIRSGPRLYDAADVSRPTWAGFLPITEHVAATVPDADTPVDMPLADSITRYIEARAAGSNSQPTTLTMSNAPSM